MIVNATYCVNRRLWRVFYNFHGQFLSFFRTEICVCVWCRVVKLESFVFFPKDFHIHGNRHGIY